VATGAARESAPEPLDEETAAALARLSAVVWKCLLRIEENERRRQREQLATSPPQVVRED
jgi:hypothetical protein